MEAWADGSRGDKVFLEALPARANLLERVHGAVSAEGSHNVVAELLVESGMVQNLVVVAQKKYKILPFDRICTILVFVRRAVKEVVLAAVGQNGSALQGVRRRS